ncbi:hypothetical protein Tco_0089092 [Tanacetum coccineum]
MAKLILNEAQAEQYLAEPSIESNEKYELSEELLKELRSNSYRGRVEEDVVGHIATILEILNPIEVDIFSKEDLKGTRIEHGFKRAFMSLFGQDFDTFTSTMLLNIDQLQKQLDKDEFQEDGSMAAFWVINNQFQKFIDSQFSLDYDSQMTDKYFVEYTGIETQKSKIDTGKAVDADLVVTKSSGTESEVQDDSNRSGNDTDADDVDIRLIYDEEPMAETIEQTTSLLANNADLKAQIQEKVFAIDALKNDLRKLKGNSVHTKFTKTSVLGKPVLQSLRNQSVVRQLNAFKSERPQIRESVFVKPDHMIASSESRNSSKNMPRFSSNDMVHNHYLDEARKKTQERDRNSKTSVIPSARFQSIADGNKPKPRSTNHSTRSLPVPTGKILASCTSKDDSEPTHGSNGDISNIHECKQTLDVSAGTSINVQKEQSFDLSAGTSNNVKPDNLRVWLLKKLISQKPVLKWIQN